MSPGKRGEPLIASRSLLVPGLYAWSRPPNTTATSPSAARNIVLTFSERKFHHRTMMQALYNRPRGASKPPKTPRKRQSLIGNEMHSPASATAVKCATSIFLIGNEFHLQGRSFRRIFARRPKWRRACLPWQAAALQNGEASRRYFAAWARCFSCLSNAFLRSRPQR